MTKPTPKWLTLPPATITIACAALLGFVFWTTPLVQAEPPTRNILFLFAFEHNVPSYHMIEVGVRRILEGDPTVKCVFFSEHMDLARFQGEAYRESLVEQYRLKYTGKKIDLIVVLNTPALDFINQYREQIFPGVPVIFSLMLKGQIEKRKLLPNITGVADDPDFTGTLDLALRLLPGTKRVFVISGAAEADKGFENQVRKAYKPYEGRFEFTYLSGLPMAALLKEVASLPMQSVIIYSSIYKDGLGQAFVPIKALQLISPAANAPIFGAWNPFLGNGAVGGRVADLVQDGLDVGHLALDVLRGGPSKPILNIRSGKNTVMVDWRQMKRWGLSLDLLPPGSAVMFQKKVFWNHYKWEAVGVIALLLLESLLIGLLLAQRARRLRAEYSLQLAVQDLDQKVNDRTRDLEKANKHLLLEIKEREVVEEALRASEKGLRATLDATPFPIAIVDPNDNQILYWSRSAIELFGHTAPTTSEWYMIAYPDPDYRRSVVARWKPFLDHARESGDSVNAGEYQVTCSDGSVRTCQLYAKFTTEHLIVTFNDITDRKRAEVDLRVSEEKFRKLAESINEVFWLGSSDWNKIYYISPAFERVWGISCQTLYQDPHIWLEAILPEDRDSALAGIPQQVKPGTEIVFPDYRIRRPDGSVRWISARAFPIADETGRVYQVSGIAMDITERKQNEEALRESERLYRLTFESIPDSITITRVTDGRYLYVNDGFCKLTGYTCDEVLGKTPSDINLYAYPEERVKMMQVLRRDGQLLNFEVKFRNKEGTVWDSLFSALPMKIGGEDCLVALAKDVSEQKSMEKDRARLEKQLSQAQKMDALGTLSSGIAHDFNNILAAIMGYAELAIDDLPPDMPVREDLVAITKAALKAKALVRQILTFSRTVEGEKRPLSLNKVAGEANAILERTLPKMINLRLDLQDDLHLVRADANQMEQIIINLASNAGDAIEGSGNIIISTRNMDVDKCICEVCGKELSGRHVLIKVKDDGAGMSPEVMEKIYDPFFTTKGVGKGTGLGLSTVYGIVVGHHGHIHCQSELDEGTEFSIYLPAISQRERISEPNTPHDAEDLGGSGRVLLVDDDPSVRDIAQKMLARSGYEVLLAASGEEAIGVYEKNKDEIDLVLLDLGMPGMGGKACLEELRRIDPDAKVLIASGYIQYELTDELESLGAAGMVSKPYSKADILKAVKEALGS